MKRETFLLIGSIGQLFSGMYFLLFSEPAASQLLKEITTKGTLLFEKNIGVFSIAFGLITFVSRKSPDTIALKAIFIGTLFYLIASVCIDVYGIVEGIFFASGWGGIIVRMLFIAGYFYYFSKMRIQQTINSFSMN